ncbi:MAG: hypothetical protein M3044_04710 [Thermoproteota archaeon]|nr:hypothetical protein [Thermoproteota archaeon]
MNRYTLHMLNGVAYTDLTTTSATSKDIPYEKKVVVKNLYISNIAEEFIAMQVDLEIPLVISILKELDVYKGDKDEKKITDIGKS